jgi:hypothetical protein
MNIPAQPQIAQLSDLMAPHLIGPEKVRISAPWQILLDPGHSVKRVQWVFSGEKDRTS